VSGESRDCNRMAASMLDTSFTWTPAMTHRRGPGWFPRISKHGKRYAFNTGASNEISS
jgi:hypothetical protein